MQKIRVNGLKLSSELVRLHVEFSENNKSTVADVCRLLNDHKINILFMTTAEQSEQKCGLFCIDADKRHQVESLIENEPWLKAHAHIYSDAGLLTLFPHQSRLTMLGIVLQALGDNKIPIYGIASSIAAIAFVIDYSNLDAAARGLAKSVELPENATPVKSILKVKQIDSKA